MSHVEVLSAVGLIRTSRRRGFCPACRLFRSGDTPKEIAAPGLHLELGNSVVTTQIQQVVLERFEPSAQLQ